MNKYFEKIAKWYDSPNAVSGALTAGAGAVGAVIGGARAALNNRREMKKPEGQRNIVNVGKHALTGAAGLATTAQFIAPAPGIISKVKTKTHANLYAAGVGAVNGVSSYHSTKAHNELEMSKKEKDRKIHNATAAGIVSGVVTGGFAAAASHGKLFGEARGAHGFGGPKGNESAPNHVKGMHDVMGSGHVKTKKEFEAHFRKERSKAHPDRYTEGTPEHKKASEKMKSLNTARDAFMAHPDGFEKLARNKYLRTVFA